MYFVFSHPLLMAAIPKYAAVTVYTPRFSFQRVAGWQNYTLRKKEGRYCRSDSKSVRLSTARIPNHCEFFLIIKKSGWGLLLDFFKRMKSYWICHVLPCSVSDTSVTKQWHFFKDPWSSVGCNVLMFSTNFWIWVCPKTYGGIGPKRTDAQVFSRETYGWECLINKTALCKSTAVQAAEGSPPILKHGPPKRQTERTVAAELSGQEQEEKGMGW